MEIWDSEIMAALIPQLKIAESDRTTWLSDVLALARQAEALGGLVQMEFDPEPVFDPFFEKS